MKTKEYESESGATGINAELGGDKIEICATDYGSCNFAVVKLSKEDAKAFALELLKIVEAIP